MRLLTVPVLAAALLLAACGTSSSGPGSTGTPTVPTMAPPGAGIPPAAGRVTGVGMVIEGPGTPPEVCLGPVRESWPPQCDGIALSGWDWAQHPPEQETDPEGPPTRWGSFAVAGTFDGMTLTVTDAVPLALYDTMAEPTPTPPTPPDLTDDEWAAVLAGAAAAPGMLGVDRGESGPVHLSVVHDDGTIQAWADASFGAGAVLVSSALR
ncbi:hypothetical protein GCM10023168_14250 [Fodinibacter luteus]|uniref:Uncharacterized protein n=1 Tax=Fodinibacter luteus TaxID=552064 RepID=A0ABP8KB03_9MICO